MTTLALSSTISIATTALLRSLGSELNGYLSTVGLVQQADTGQVNWSTVNLPAGNTAIGYEIWAFPDLSIFFRIDWKTPATPATMIPTMTLTVGTGSNGSGTITGQMSSANLVISQPNSSISSPTTNYTTYACLTPDAFWIVWKALATTSSSCMTFCIEKTCDSTGAATNTGYCVSYISNLSSAHTKQPVRTASPATTFPGTTSFCIVPGNVLNSSTAAGSKQVFLHQYPIPDITLSNVMVTLVAVEAPISTTFTATPVGTTPQTMISMGTQFGYGNNASASSNWSVALRWQ